MGKYTKKAAREIFAALENDQDFKDLFLKYWTRKHPNDNQIKRESDRAAMRAEYFEILRDCIACYLCDFDYLDKQYLDVAHLVIMQYGKPAIVDLDSLYDLFKSTLDEK
jgi:hypothetical protein